jgi:hypothetical protein
MISSSSPSILTSVPDHLPNSTRVADLDVRLDQPSGLVAPAGADRHDLAFLRLLLGGVRNDDAALGLGFGVDPLHHHAVMQGAKIRLGHGFLVIVGWALEGG